MTVATQKKSTALRGRLDLSGDWPVIHGVEWDKERYLDDEDWSSLTDDERAKLRAWMTANHREIRLTIIGGEDRFRHYPVSDILEISTAPTDRVELCIDADSIRHADAVSIVVLNTDSRNEAEAIFLQWLEDVAKHLAAKRDASVRLTA